MSARPISWVSGALAAMAVAACSDVQTFECGPGWRWIAAGSERACVHESGEPTCPPDAPHPVPIAGAVVCAPRPFTADAIPSGICAQIPACVTDGGS